MKADDARRLADNDLYLYNEGTHRRVFDFLGAHVVGHGVPVRGVGPERSGRAGRRKLRRRARARDAARAIVGHLERVGRRRGRR